MSFILDKWTHDRFAFDRFAFINLNSTQYKMYAQQYSNVKAGGIGCIYAWASVRGVAGVITNIGKGVIIYYGKVNLLLFVLMLVLMFFLLQ